MTTHLTANPWSTGTDELERYALEECVKRQRIDHRVSILVVSDKRCEMAPKLARLGAQVVIVDRPDYRQEIEGRILASGLREQISYVASELDTMPEALPGQPFDMIVLRRGLCGQPYEQACQIVRRLMRQLRIGGKLYVSVLGLHSELGQGYADGDALIEQRFAPLASPLAEKYEIHQPVCLYTERNLFMLLLEAGASVLRTLTTTYGNVKGIAVRV
ncbi:MAG: class I SAM-dependent methyltransferase [Betaproteobacteria bacterium]|nr:class I SAM-dependent methyltransferase [Betaproteobacteria bacterium]